MTFGIWSKKWWHCWIHLQCTFFVFRNTVAHIVALQFSAVCFVVKSCDACDLKHQQQTMATRSAMRTKNTTTNQLQQQLRQPLWLRSLPLFCFCFCWWWCQLLMREKLVLVPSCFFCNEDRTNNNQKWIKMKRSDGVRLPSVLLMVGEQERTARHQRAQMRKDCSNVTGLPWQKQVPQQHGGNHEPSVWPRGKHHG